RRRKMRFTSLRSFSGIACTLALAACESEPIDPPRGEQVSELSAEPAIASPGGYAGAFRYLPSVQSDLGPHITTRTHPSTYVIPPPAGGAAITQMMTSIFDALDASLNGLDGNWCQAVAAASTAGYALQRIRDTTSGRWFLHGYDTANSG